MVEQLQDKNIQRFFMVVNEAGGDDLKQMAKWASQPWETNLLHVPGLEALRADESVWVQKAVVMFCPMSLSPTATVEQEQIQGYMMVKESGYCGERGELLSKDIQDAAGCAYLAQGAGSSAFLVGTWFRRGYCYTSPLAVDAETYGGWETDRINPACSAADGWTQSQLFDFYALEPTGYNEGPSLA